FEDGRHRLAHVPDIDMRVLPIAALPDLALIGRPADPVHQSRTLARALRQFGGDDAAGLQVGDLHAPEAGHVVHDITAGAVDRVGTEDAGIGPDPRHRVARRIDAI